MLAQRLAAALALLLALVLATPATAQTFPKLTGRVVDGANLLPQDREAALDAKLAQLETSAGRQFVVATVPTLQGYPIEDYGYRLGRAWGIGSAKLDDGLILLVAPTERKVRVEVGYGLTPIVTDALSDVVIRQQIVPRFKDGDFAGGIEAGSDALIALLRLPDEQAAARARALVADSEREADSGIPVALIFWGIVLAVVLISMLRGRERGRRYGSAPVIIWGGGGSSWGGGGGGWSSGGGGFSGGGGSFGGGGASGSW